MLVDLFESVVDESRKLERTVRGRVSIACEDDQRYWSIHLALLPSAQAARLRMFAASHGPERNASAIADDTSRRIREDYMRLSTSASNSHEPAHRPLPGEAAFINTSRVSRQMLP